MNNPPPTCREQPLLEIPEAGARIFSSYLVVSNLELFQLQTADTGEILSFKEVSSSSLESPLKNKAPNKENGDCKIIKFDNPEFAFNVLEETKIIQFHNIGAKTVELELKVKTIGTLLTVQSLLRRKMCEMGFQRRYQKVQKLGSGATAQVYLVKRKSDGKKFAAKIISIKGSSEKAYVIQAQWQDTFLNEAKLLRLIQHKNIVSLQSLYVQKKHLIEVLQYLDGGTLLMALRNGQCRREYDRWCAIKDLTEALEHMRQKRIVHRDIKLENIMVRKGIPKNEYVLTDFGLACWAGQQKPLFEKCGTPGYIAPEVLQAQKGSPVLDHRIDIFSLGVVAHLVFLLQPLFQYTGNVKDLLKANKKAQFYLQGQKYDQLSSVQYHFLESALKININQRATAQNLLACMESISYVTPKKAKSKQRNHEQQFKMEMKEIGVEVKIKKAASLTKKNISLDVPKKNASAQKRSTSAKKLFQNIWNSFTSPREKSKGKPTKAVSNLKVKENSLEKHKNLKDFFE